MQMPEQHQDADRILQRLQQEQIRAFYHFTSIENLPSIRDTQALCSKELLEEEGRWPVPEPGGNRLSHYLNNINENWNLISLSFTPRTPMAYRKKPESHLCFFVIRPDVAT